MSVQSVQREEPQLSAAKTRADSGPSSVRPVHHLSAQPSARQLAAIDQRLRIWPLLDAGLYPIPVHPQTRRPLVPFADLQRLGYRPGIGQDLVGDLGDGKPNHWVPLVFEWWGAWPWAGAAILCELSRVILVDVDPRNGGDRTFRQLAARHDFPRTRAVRTRSGGLHLLYASPTLVKSDGNVLGAGIDIKSRGGLAYAPPTPGYELLPGPRRPAPAPPWLVKACGGAHRARPRKGDPLPTVAFDDPTAQAVLASVVAKMEEAADGRHNTIYKQACRAFRASDTDQMEAVLIKEGQRIEDPAQANDVIRTVQDARRKTREAR